MTYITAPGKFGVSRFLINSGAGDVAVEGHPLLRVRGPRSRGLADLSVVILAHRFRTRRLLTFDERDFRAVTPLSGGSFTLLPHDSARA
jgi:hypothetical protein